MTVFPGCWMSPVYPIFLSADHHSVLPHFNMTYFTDLVYLLVSGSWELAARHISYKEFPLAA